MEESRNRNSENEKPEKKAHDSRSVGNGITSNGTLKRKTPSYVSLYSCDIFWWWWYPHMIYICIDLETLFK